MKKERLKLCVYTCMQVAAQTFPNYFQSNQGIRGVYYRAEASLDAQQEMRKFQINLFCKSSFILYPRIIKKMCKIVSHVV